MKAYNVQGWLFASKDLAIIAGNEKHVQELDVPEDTELIHGTIHMVQCGVSEDQKIRFELSLSNNFDCSDLCDYAPIVKFEFDDERNDDDEFEAVLSHWETEWCNWKIEDLSSDLQHRVKAQLEIECSKIDLSYKNYQ